MRSHTTNPTDGVEIAYEVSGDGEPLLLVHGSGLSRGIWRGLGYLRDLERDFTVVALDLRGHGRSGTPHDIDSYAMPLHVGDVLAVLEATGLDPVHYVGYSFGARLGLVLAAEHPEHLRTLTTIGGSWEPMRGNIAETFTPEWRKALRDGGMAAFLTAWEDAIGAPVDPATRLAFMADDPEALVAFFEASERGDGVPLEILAQVTTPTLLLAGTRDDDRHRQAQQAARVMPRASFYSLVGYHHGSSLAPVDEITDLVRTLIETTDAS